MKIVNIYNDSDNLDILGAAATLESGESRCTEWLLQRIAVAIQKANAWCMLGSIPSEERLPD